MIHSNTQHADNLDAQKAPSRSRSVTAALSRHLVGVGVPALVGLLGVGTHALTAASKATLWDRLRQHRGHLAGRDPGSGNHCASVFRRHVGAALIQRDGPAPGLMASWLDRHGPHPGWASQETAVEMAVSRHIGAMPVFWLCVLDPSTRGYVERNSIALTSQLAAGQDPPSPSWLGHRAIPGQIRQSDYGTSSTSRNPATQTSCPHSNS